MPLNKRLERAETKRRIAQAQAAEKSYRAYINENIAFTRKRKLGWTTPGNAERDFGSHDRKKAIATARQKVEETPLIAAIHQARLDHIVGNGFRLMMRSGDRDWDREVEKLWEFAKDTLDIRGVRSWRRMLRCLQGRRDVDGDVGAILVGDGQSKIQIIEADRICKDPDDSADTGIDFDQYGRPVRYYVVQRDNDAKARGRPYDARDFIFHCNDLTERAERQRGMTAYLQVFNLVSDYSDILEGMVQKVKNEAFIALKFWMQPGGDGNLFGDAQSTLSPAENGYDYSRVKMVPGMNLVLGDGEQVDVLESKSPHSEFQSFEKKIISRIAAPLGMTYELVTGDYSGLNDRLARVMMEGFKKRVRPEQAELGIHASRIFQWWLSREIKAGTIAPPSGLETWWNHRWGKPGFPYINVLQEAQANSLLLEKGLTSRTKILAEQGDEDFDDLMDELAYETESIAERNIPTTMVNGPAANRRAALQDDTEQEEDDTDVSEET